MDLPLEDLYADVIGKAQKGLGLKDEVLLQSSGVSEQELARVRDNLFEEPVARRLALVLGLDADALCDLGRGTWHPHPVTLQGLKQFNTTWQDMTVNAWLVWDEQSRQAVVFDTGADATPILEFIRQHNLNLELILLTHAHADHVAALDALREYAPTAPVYLHEEEQFSGKTEKVTEGDVFQVGWLKVEVRFTPGHSPGGTTYVVSMPCSAAQWGGRHRRGHRPCGSIARKS